LCFRLDIFTGVVKVPRARGVIGFINRDAK